MKSRITRRNLVKVSLAGVAGLGVGFYLYDRDRPDLADLLGAGKGFLPNAFLHISYGNDITFYCKNPEIGQGIQTAFAVLVAEELDLKVADIKVVQAPVSYKIYGRQITGGSLSVKNNYLSTRYSASAVHQLLIFAASELFSEPDLTLISLENKEAHHLPSGKRVTYGDLARVAHQFPLPEENELQLKPRSEFNLIGKPHSGVKNREMLNATLKYVSDLNDENMLYANFIRPSNPGATLLSFNEDELRAMPGVVDVRYIPDNSNSGFALSGIALVGESCWTVLKARKALKASWQEPLTGTPLKESENNSEFLRQTLKKGNTSILASRLPNDAHKLSDEEISVSYSYPFLAHNVMENQVCVAQYLPNDDIKLRLWQNSQKPYHGLKGAAAYLGISVDQVSAQQVQAGGGFGRRLYNDVLVQVAAISKALPGQKTQLFYTKEDEFTNDYFRAACIHEVRCSGDIEGNLIDWQQTVSSLSNTTGEPVVGARPPTTGLPYDWASKLEVKLRLSKVNIRCGAWRSPSANGHAFATQSALQELAHSLNIDYQKYLLNMLNNSERQLSETFSLERAKRVIKRVCEIALWGRSEKGFGQGLAFYESHSGYFAEIVSLRMHDASSFIIEDVFAVGDVGLVVNPSGARAQVKGAILDALEASLFQLVEFDSTGVLTKSLASYKTLKCKHVPNISVEFIESDERPTGLGEPALPPLAPALCHALFNATGVRVRDLPVETNSIFSLSEIRV